MRRVALITGGMDDIFCTHLLIPDDLDLDVELERWRKQEKEWRHANYRYLTHRRTMVIDPSNLTPPKPPPYVDFENWLKERGAKDDDEIVVYEVYP